MNQSPIMENRKAIIIRSIPFFGLEFLIIRINDISIPNPAVPDLKIKLEVLSARIAEIKESIKRL